MPIKIRFTVINDEEKTPDITFDMTEDQAREVPVVSIAALMDGYMRWLTQRMDEDLMALHPLFRNYSSLRQTQILGEFRQKYSMYDLSNPPAPRKSPILIVK